jgi:hypothetical protein
MTGFSFDVKQSRDREAGGIAKARGTNRLFAEESAGYTKEKDLENGHCMVAAKHSICNSAADNCRHAKENQDAQSPAHIHLEKSPVCVYIIGRNISSNGCSSKEKTDKFQS